MNDININNRLSYIIYRQLTIGSNYFNPNLFRVRFNTFCATSLAFNAPFSKNASKVTLSFINSSNLVRASAYFSKINSYKACFA